MQWIRDGITGAFVIAPSTFAGVDGSTTSRARDGHRRCKAYTPSSESLDRREYMGEELLDSLCSQINEYQASDPSRQAV